MTKYEIFTDTFEFRLWGDKERIPSMSGDEIMETYFSGDTRITSNSLDPVKQAAFDSYEDAEIEFGHSYANYGCTRLEKGNLKSLYLLRGEIAWIEENEYDEDGEFDQGGTVLCFSAEPYEVVD